MLIQQKKPCFRDSFHSWRIDYTEFQKDPLKSPIASNGGYPPLCGLHLLAEKCLNSKTALAEMVCATVFKAFVCWNRSSACKLIRLERKITLLCWGQYPHACLSHPSLLLYLWMLCHHYDIWHIIWLFPEYVWSVAKNCRIKALSSSVLTWNLPICSNRQHNS